MRINDFINSNNDVEYYDGLIINRNSLKSTTSTLNSYKKKKEEANKKVKEDTQKIGKYLNERGLNVNINSPFQANVVSNSQINKSRNNLSGRVTLEDVVQEHSKVLNGADDTSTVNRNKKQDNALKDRTKSYQNILENRNNLTNLKNGKIPLKDDKKNTNVQNTESIAELRNNLRLSRNERATAGYNYDYARVENEDTTLVDKTIGIVPRAVSDFFSNMGAFSRDYVDEDGNKTRLASYSELKQQKVSNDYDTKVGKFLGDAAYNATKIGTANLLNVATFGVGGSAVYWSDMFFDAYNNVKNEGYDDSKAFTYALANTGFEFVVGKFLGSATKKLTGGKTSQLSNFISNGVNKLISNPKIASIIGNAGSEAVEEFVQEYLDNINRLITLEGSKNAKDYIDVIFSTDVLEDAIYSAGVGALSGGVLQGINNVEGKVTKNNTELFKVFRNELENSKQNTTDKATIEKYEKAIKDIDDYIANPFGKEKQAENILPTVEDLVKKQSQNTSINQENTNLPTVEDVVKREQTKNSNTNANMPIRNYQYVETGNTKIDNLRKSVSQYFDDSNTTKDMVNTIEKIIGYKDYNVVFENNITNDKGVEVNGLITTNNNNEVEIKINPNSERAIEFLLTHEITHAIETDSMKKLIIDYASKNSEFNQALESLKQTYGTNDVTSEVVADISGQLLGNQEFINSLTTQNTVQSKSIIKTIYENIRRLLNTLTENGKYRNFIQDLEAKWREAYRTTTMEQAVSNLNNELKYSKEIEKSDDLDYNINNLDSYEVKEGDLINSFYKKLSKREWKIYHSKMNNVLRQTYGDFTRLDRVGNKLIQTQFANGKEQVVNVYHVTENALYLCDYVLEEVNNGYYTNEQIQKFVETMFREEDVINYNRANNIHERITERESNSRKTFENSKSRNRTTNETRNSIINRELDNSSFSLEQHKQKQFDIILKNNPVQDDYHTWIRSVDDIKTFKETLEDTDYKEYYEAGEDFDETYTADMAKKALETGKITVYSSYPIEQGIFVSPSQMEAESYSGTGKVYSKEVSLKDVAWIDPTQGQYAKVNTKLSQNNQTLEKKADSQGRTLTKEQQEYFKDSKVRDGKGNLKVMYHGTKSGGFTVFDINKTKSSGNYGTGFYFSPTKDYSSNYVDNSSNSKMYEVYLNITEPVDAINRSRTLSNEQVRKLVETVAKNENYGIENYGYNATVDSVTNDLVQHNNDFEILSDLNIMCVGNFVELVELTNKVLGTTFDGIITPTETIAFYPNQIKNVDNVNPTTNEDIRYSKQDNKWQEYLEENYPARGTRTFSEDIKLPTKEDIKRMNIDSVNLPKTKDNTNNTNKIMDPLEISNLRLNNANTTPNLPIKKVSTGKGESKFAKNIENKTNMLTKESKYEILDSNEVNFYQEVTNKGSLEKAFAKLNDGGESETINWFNKKSENATDVDVAEGWILLKQYQDKIQNAKDLATKDTETRNMVQVAKKMREMGTKAGQTVQAYNILNRLTPEGMVYYAQSELSEAFDLMSKNKTQKWIDSNREKFNITSEETSFIMETMKKVQKMEDGYEKRVELAKIQKIMTDKLPPQRGAGIKAWMRISMLFNPKTQVRNVAGNAVIAPVNAFSDLFSSMADKVIGSKTGYRTTGVTNIQNYVKGFKQGAYQSYNDFKQGINTRNIQGNRFEIGEGKSFNNNTTMGKALNRVDSLLSFMLDAGDRTFYEATFTNSINNQLVLNNTTEVTQTMIDIATQEALSRTWQDNNGYTRFVLNIRKGLNAVNIGGYGLGDVLIPFAKTPANLTKAIVDYSPAGLVNTLVKGKNLKNSIETGQFTPQMQHDFVQSLGKTVAGTILYVVGYALAKAGITSGESDDDKDVQNFMKNTLGVNSYSIKIGNKSFSYDWAQPIAAPLSIMANIVQKDNEDASTLEKVLSSLDTAGNILLEQSFMESINTALSNNDGLATGIEEAILDLPARAIPTFMKQIADMVDGTQRTSFEYDKPLESSINAVKAKIPFLSKTLAPSVDSMGREIQKYGGKNNIFNVFFNPANVSTENISTSAKEIYRLYKETGETSIMPRVAPYYVNKDGEKIILNNKERATYQKISGEIIETEIQKLLNNSTYKNMSDEEKAFIIKDIVNYSYNIAQQEILGTGLSDMYQKAFEYSKIGDICDYYTFKASVDDSNSVVKKESITNYLINSNLNDEQLAYLYSKYYSSEETLEVIQNAGISIKEFIKYNSKEFTSNYYANGKTVPNSRRNKVIRYVNSLNLTIPQKAILIKLEYNSYDAYDRQIINYINNISISKSEKEEILEDMGFTIRNGKVYS